MGGSTTPVNSESNLAGTNPFVGDIFLALGILGSGNPIELREWKIFLGHPGWDKLHDLGVEGTFPRL